MAPGVFTHVVNGANIRMVQSRRRTCLSLEPFNRLWIVLESWGEKFQCDGALQPGVFRLVHDAHAALSKLLAHNIMRDGLADHGASVRKTAILAQVRDL